MLSFRKAAQFSQDRGGYFCVLLLSLPKEYPNPNHEYSLFSIQIDSPQSSENFKSLDFIAFTGYTGLNDICIKIGGFFT